MDDETKAVLVLALKLRQYSDNDIVILNAGPLREILEQAREDVPDSCETSDHPH